MGQLDTRLLADIPGAFTRGHLGAQRQNLNDLKIDAYTRQRAEENNLRALFATRQPGEDYGSLVQRGAQMGVDPGSLFKLEGLGLAKQRTDVMQKGQLRKEAVGMYKAAEMAVNQAAKQGDQAAVDKAVEAFKSWANTSGNPYGKQVAEIVQRVKVHKKGGVEITSILDGSQLKKLFPGAKPGVKYKVKQAPDKLEIEEQKPEKTDRTEREFARYNESLRKQGKKPIPYTKWYEDVYKKNTLAGLLGSAVDVPDVDRGGAAPASPKEAAPAAAPAPPAPTGQGAPQQQYTEEDIRFTAQKYGITEEEVRRRLGIK